MFQRFFAVPLILLSLVMGMIICLPLTSAQAHLTISPLRVVFDGRTRSADIMLINTSPETNTYRMRWVYNVMDTYGSYKRADVTLTPAFDVAEGVIFSPRQVTLPPEGRQRVRLSLRRPAELPDGEYRAHLVFQKLPNENDPALRQKQDNPPKRGQTLALNVLMGFSIPVIVRQGDYDADISISKPEFVPGTTENGGKPQIKLTLSREGKHSSIGRVIVTWDKSKDPYKRIGVLNNVSVFPEIKERILNIDLLEPNVSGGTVTVTYYGDGPQKGEILAEKTFQMGG
ncbi:MAG: molecular chaperone [Alphaproteobacteria bacterium]|nr:molecular chaperone [Alphaproteobacteria bacterium]